MSAFTSALGDLADPLTIVLLVIGCSWGVVSGAIPGMTPSIGMALLLPFTFSLDPIQAVVLLAAAWSGSEFGGAIPAVLINSPGTPASAATTMDGYQLHLQGKGGKALGAALVWGLIGQFVAVIVCGALLIPLSHVLLAFGPAEIFAVAVFGLTVVASFSGSGVLKAIASLVLGLVIAAIGFDPFSGTTRFDFGLAGLEDGLGIVPVLIGLFAIGELLHQASVRGAWGGTVYRHAATKLPTLNELKEMRRAGFIATIVGIVVGIMPGAGSTASSYVAYNEARRWSRHPERFGKGTMEGVVASEAANNANIPGALVPMLAFAVPGDSASAVLMSGLLIQGIRPGPGLFSQDVDLLWGLFLALILANPVVLGTGLALIKPVIRAVRLPKPYVLMGIFGLVVTGSYAAANSIFDVGVVLVFGLVGWGMLRTGFSPAATVLGVVLGEILEGNLRRALTLSNGELSFIYTEKIALVFLVLAALALLYPLATSWYRARGGRPEPPAAEPAESDIPGGGSGAVAAITSGTSDRGERS
jgi:putative tricarboxylic transport membrane protein